MQVTSFAYKEIVFIFILILLGLSAVEQEMHYLKK